MEGAAASTRPKTARMRALTEKAQSLFLHEVESHEKRVAKLKGKILDVFNGTLPLDETRLDLLIDKYNYSLEGYLNYLQTVRSAESLAYVETVKKNDEVFQVKLQRHIRQSGHESTHHVYHDEVPVKKDDLTLITMSECSKSRSKSSVHESTHHVYHDEVPLKKDNLTLITMSECSKSRSKSSVHSYKSSKSKASSLARKRREEVEAARTRAQFAIREAEILKQEAEIKARLKVLETEKELHEAEAKLRVAESCSSEGESESSGDDSFLRAFRRDRTASYVAQQSPQVPDMTHSPGLNVNAPTFQPQLQHRNNSDGNNEVYSSLSKFLMRKELSLNRLSQFDDTPEFYSVWKSGFKGVVRELDLLPEEELDLLIKYLGPQSRKWATSLRSSNIHNSDLGLCRIWERLDDRFAPPEVIEASIKKKLSEFPKLTNKDNKKLYDLCDIVAQIQSLKESSKYQSLFSYFDTSSGVNPIVAKLPYNVQEKWTSKAMAYKLTENVPYPPFSFFTKFLNDVTRMRNDPSFCYESPSEKSVKDQKPPFRNSQPRLNVKKSETKVSSPTNTSQETHKTLGPSKSSVPTNSRTKVNSRYCVYHDSNSHILNFCKKFRSLSVADRKDFLKKKKVCLRCCISKDHVTSDCNRPIYCGICKASDHVPALHCDNQSSQIKSAPVVAPQGGETVAVNSSCTKVGDDISIMSNDVASQLTLAPITKHGGEVPTIHSSCTQICNEPSASKSCAKTFLVKVFPDGFPDLGILCYAIVDDQSNCSLAKTKFFDLFNEQGSEIQYCLSSCAGTVNMSGRKTGGYSIQPMEGEQVFAIRSLIECNEIPNLREEIPTPEVAHSYSHLAEIAHHIPPIKPNVEILLLIGRDVPSAHHVLDQRIGPADAPFAQKTNMGWAIIGDVCLNGVHIPPVISVTKTSLLFNGRPSLFEPCDQQLQVDEVMANDPLFVKTKYDENHGLSIEDKEFLSIMNDNFSKDSAGNWVAPLPFRTVKPEVVNNREYVWGRMQSLHRGLLKNNKKRTHMVEFMAKVFERGHAEVAPPLDANEECWYLPLFGVYHPKKLDKIRVVFDSSAKLQGVSLNDLLLKGPDLTNSLLGILLRFRQESVAVAADVEQMFYNFKVREDHRNYLRFFWYRNNDPQLEFVEYRMTVHVFGNTPSPAIATYGLRKSVEQAQSDVQEFITRNFYVDDGLVSLKDAETARDLIKRTQEALFEGGRLRLCKIVSNDKSLLSEFPSDDLADGLKQLDFSSDSAPLQSSLGLLWDINKDSFTYKFYETNKPFTKRGVLSAVNSLYDPMGFIAPVVILGKLFFRDITSLNCGWDEPLPESYSSRWSDWIGSLSQLQGVNIRRTYAQDSLSQATSIELHTFSDASTEAIGAVSYLKVFHGDRVEVCFLLGKAKVAPLHGHTIPRLELCAAVMAVELCEAALEQLDISPNSVHFYTDSKIVLGYIFNETRRFHVYVTNRVDRIRQLTQTNQWNFVPTHSNPADLATRGLEAKDVQSSQWLHGPSFLQGDELHAPRVFPLVNPDEDREVRALVSVKKGGVVADMNPIAKRFEKFSCWKSLLRTVALLKHIAKSFKEKSTTCRGWHLCSSHKTVLSLQDAENYIIKEVQGICFKSDITAIKQNSNLSTASPIKPFSPILDQFGILRVGGRLSEGSASLGFPTQPILIPKNHHIAILIIRYFHQLVHHQGRHITEGAIRTGGFWLLGGKRMVSRVIHLCVTCRKLRGKAMTQKMGNLPPDRIHPSPPFTFVGVDLFGPWHVTSRRTRGGIAESKRWGVLFTCLVSRAIHIEVAEELSTSSFINALRRFISIRGPVKQMRSDRGTNFIGAVKELGLSVTVDEGGPIQRFLSDAGCTWIFNPPHASHMGGAWERMIGLVRRIIDAMLLNHRTKYLTHEVLTTFFAEVCTIVNSRPIVSVSTDPDDPFVLSPSLLLTQKVPNTDINFPNFDYKEVYKAHWKHVQVLADEFWRKWKREFVHTLQPKRKWSDASPNIQEGNVILLNTPDLPRGQWPLAIVERVFPGDDGLVRKVEVRISQNGKPIRYVRPVSELVCLV